MSNQYVVKKAEGESFEFGDDRVSIIVSTKLKQTACRFALLAALVLGSGFAFGQSLRELAGKWVLDLDKMYSVHPEWQGELSPDMWIVTGSSDREFRIWRGVEATEVRQPDEVELYAFDGPITRIPFGDSEAMVEARWERDRVVATVAPGNGDADFIRKIYREDQWLVIEDTQGDAGSFRWYFVKS